MKKFLITGLLLLFCTAAGAQSVERQVIGSAGGSFSGSFSLDWTAGETVITTGTAGSVVLNQGFQQPPAAALSTRDLEAAGLRAWPNPTEDQVNLTWPAMPGDCRVILYNAAGAQVYEGQWKAGEAYQLHLSAFAPGVYHMRLLSGQATYALKVTRF